LQASLGFAGPLLSDYTRIPSSSPQKSSAGRSDKLIRKFYRFQNFQTIGVTNVVISHAITANPQPMER